MRGVRARVAIGLAIGGLVTTLALAQDEPGEDEKKLGWSNETELSLVVTTGNSDTETFGFKNFLRHRWERSQFRLRLEGVRSSTADDRFAIVDASDLPTDPPDDIDLNQLPFQVIDPAKEPNVEKYLLEGTYRRDITEHSYWSAGAGWDRNRDAGILNRYQIFAGVGRVWWDREDFYLDTGASLSYVDREEETPDPLTDDTFSALRLDYDYRNQWGAVTTYQNVMAGNTNLSDLGDYWVDWLHSISVSMSDRLALRLSLQFLYNNEPALEDLDLVTIISNPVPEIGGPELEIGLGTVQVRKEKLDTVFNASLVVSF